VPITVAAWSKAWTVFTRSNTGIVDSNPTQGMDVFECVYSVFVLYCIGNGLDNGLILGPWSPTDCLGLKCEVKQSVSWMAYAPKCEQQEKRERVCVSLVKNWGTDI
jgi:hypothetical protein